MLPRLLVMFFVAALIFCSDAEAQTLPPPANPLAGDSRLDRKVTLRAEGLPVSELLGLLSQKTGIGLSVEQDIGKRR